MKDIIPREQPTPPAIAGCIGPRESDDSGRVERGSRSKATGDARLGVGFAGRRGGLRAMAGSAATVRTAVARGEAPLLLPASSLRGGRGVSYGAL